MTQPTRFTHSLRKLFAHATLISLSLGTLVMPALSSPASSSKAANSNQKTIPASNTLEDSPKAVVDEVWQLINNEFVDKKFNHVDWQTKRQELLNKDYSSRKQAYKEVVKMLKELGDPYTRFLDPDDFQDLTNQTSGEMSGVGLKMTLDKRTSDLYVVEPIKNSPAMKAGVKTGDRIVKINGRPTALMNLQQASQEIQGKIGTEVNLQLSRQGKGVFNVTLKRVQIELDSVTYSLKENDNLRVGYIRLDEFSSHAAEQMKVAIDDLGKKKITGYVLDLRGNPGGLLFASVDIARMWLKQGEIVSTVDRKGGDRHFSANGTAITNLPLVILVDNGSASASEILTGALKENGRATIVGTTTYGKGTVQSVHSLSDGSGLAVTIARYYPPSGTDINHKGINPDVYLDLSVDQQLRLRNDPSLVATDVDPQYIQAISVLKKGNSHLIKPIVPAKPIGIRLPDSEDLR